MMLIVFTNFIPQATCMTLSVTCCIYWPLAEEMENKIKMALGDRDLLVILRCLRAASGDIHLRFSVTCILGTGCILEANNIVRSSK